MFPFEALKIEEAPIHLREYTQRLHSQSPSVAFMFFQTSPMYGFEAHVILLISIDPSGMRKHNDLCFIYIFNFDIRHVEIIMFQNWTCFRYFLKNIILCFWNVSRSLLQIISNSKAVMLEQYISKKVWNWKRTLKRKFEAKMCWNLVAAFSRKLQEKKDLCFEKGR